MNNYACAICCKYFSSIMSLTGHKRMHGISNGKCTNVKIMCSCVYTRRVMEVKYLEKYQAALVPCKQCNNLFRSSKQYFCSRSCSATYNNIVRGPRSTETKENISSGVSKHHQTKIKADPPGEFSKLFICSCKHCSVKFVSRTIRHYCTDHKMLYSPSAKSGYKFTFNVYNFPELFDIDLLTKVGWFSPGGKSGVWNKNGISRDHKVSVTESIKYNYDPFYITHPLNCQLMPHSENNKKKTHSSITYNDLVSLVDQYELSKAM